MARMSAPPRNPSARLAIVGLVLLALLGGCFAAGDFLKTLTDERYVDTRAFLGVPNFLNVASNLAFLAVGAAGLRLCAGARRPAALAAWRVFYLGMVLTCFGSAWFHLAPRDATLVWDRSGMIIAFVGLAFAVIEESTAKRAPLIFLLAALALGVASVWWWRRSGDMRLYSWMQLAPLACAGTSVVLNWVTPEMRRALAASFAWYVLAKLAELYDERIYAATDHLVSGHTLKHLLAAASAVVILTAQRRGAPPALGALQRRAT
ncbi:MAG TPA: ceramidase domain-containing protein [Steroidobacteraceae bacterium]|jgi:hypothetical protein